MLHVNLEMTCTVDPVLLCIRLSYICSNGIINVVITQLFDHDKNMNGNNKMVIFDRL